MRKLGKAQDHPFPKKAKFELADYTVSNTKLPEPRLQINEENGQKLSLMNATGVNYDFLTHTNK